MSTATIKERPILFSGPMVRAILDGRKTQTRRIVKWSGSWAVDEFQYPLWPSAEDEFGEQQDIPCKYGKPGDRLWVRETYAHVSMCGHFNHLHGNREWIYGATDECCVAKWTPSIHMIRAASRITLEITGVRVERLQEISEADAIAEGCVAGDGKPENGFPTEAEFPAVASYADLWNSINGPDSWAANPFVWVVEFRRVEQ